MLTMVDETIHPHDFTVGFVEFHDFWRHLKNEWLALCLNQTSRGFG